jgi:hypothetical protein
VVKTESATIFIILTSVLPEAKEYRKQIYIIFRSDSILVLRFCSSDSARVTDHQEAGKILNRKKLTAERAKPAENAEKISPIRHQAAHLPATLLRNASRCSILAPGARENARDENAQTGFPPNFPARPALQCWPQAAGELPADAQPHGRKGILFAASDLSLRPLR